MSLSDIGFSFTEAGSEAHQRLQLWQPRWPLWLGLLVAFVIVPLIGNDYWFQAILIPVLVMALAALGLNILTGYAGQASLGTAAFMSVGAFATFNILLRLPWLPLPVSIALGGVVAALVGLLFGLPSLRIKGFYLLASTLAAQFSIEWLFSQFPWFFNDASSGAISAPRLEILGYDLGSPLGRYLLTLTIVSLLTWLAVNLVKSQIGRNWMAIRDMDTAAAVIGIPIVRTKLLVFAVSSFYCGVAGALWAFAYLGTTDAHGFDLDRSFEALFIIIIGGMGSIFGNLLGAAFIVLLPIALNNLTTVWHLGDILDASLLGNLQKALFGVLIIWFLIKEPDGLARLLRSARERLSIWPLRS